MEPLCEFPNGETLSHRHSPFRESATSGHQWAKRKRQGTEVLWQRLEIHGANLQGHGWKIARLERHLMRHFSDLTMHWSTNSVQQFRCNK